MCLFRELPNPLTFISLKLPINDLDQKVLKINNNVASCYSDIILFNQNCT